MILDLGIFLICFWRFWQIKIFKHKNKDKTGESSDIEVKLEISLKEAAFGIEKEIGYTSNDICEVCNGTGSEGKDGTERCHVCGGTGQVRHSRQTLIGSVITTSVCGNCNGTGEIIKIHVKSAGGKVIISKRKL